MRQPENRFSLKPKAFPSRVDCQMQPDYFTDYIANKIYKRLNIDEKFSVTFPNYIFANNGLMQIIFDQLSSVNFTKAKLPILLQIVQIHVPKYFYDKNLAS